MAYDKPMPQVTELNRPFWEGARRHELLVQRCRPCGHMWFPPLPNCTRCLSTDIEWVATSGRGTVFSVIVYHQGWLPGYKEDLPYDVAIVELEEGVRVISNIVEIEPERIEIGMRVVATFDDVDQETSIPRFKPA